MDNENKNQNAIPNTTPPKTTTPITDTRSAVQKAQEAAEGVSKIADSANNAFSAIKWVAIAVVLLVFVGVGWTAYKVIAAPAKAVGNAVENVSSSVKNVGSSVKSGANSVKDGTSEILNRLVIETTNQTLLNTQAETAFKTLSDMEPVVVEGMKNRVYRRANFPGHENKVCELSMTFGSIEIPVLIANDNKSYATSKSLGSKKDRKTRLVIRADGDDIPLNTQWDSDTQNWVMGWKRSTISKPLSDSEAEARVLAILDSAAKACQ